MCVPAVLLRLEVAQLDWLLDGALGDALRAHLGALNHAAVLGGADLSRDLRGINSFQSFICGIKLNFLGLFSFKVTTEGKIKVCLFC